MYIYYPSNAATYIRQVGGPNMITEQWIGYGPDQVIIISGSYPPSASTAFISCSYAITYTTSMSLADTASYAKTASYSMNALGTPTASYAGTASVLNPVQPVFGITSSFNPLTGISQGQCILWVSPSTSSFLDAYGQYPNTMYGQQVRYIREQSGLQRNLRTADGSMNEYVKYTYLTNVGQNGNKTAIWCENANVTALQSAAITTPTYPLWLFVVAKMPSASVATVTLFDGIASSNRFLCQGGTTIQIYSGASMTGNVTGSLTASIQNKWFLQSFKNTAGGNGSYVNTNGTQSVVGNCGGQSITGYSMAGDYLGNGGGVSIAELMLYSNITDADAANIEYYLKQKHDLFY